MRREVWLQRQTQGEDTVETLRKKTAKGMETGGGVMYPRARFSSKHQKLEESVSPPGAFRQSTAQPTP